MVLWSSWDQPKGGEGNFDYVGCQECREGGDGDDGGHSLWSPSYLLDPMLGASQPYLV